MGKQVGVLAGSLASALLGTLVLAFSQGEAPRLAEREPSPVQV